MEVKRIKKVLIALDKDQTTNSVAEAGFSLAKDMGAQIVLLNVISDLVSYSLMEYSPLQKQNGSNGAPKLRQESVEDVIKESKAFLDDSKQRMGDKTIQTLVKEGDYADSILKAAKDYKVDLIVMGAQSKNWIKEIGGVTEKVLYHTSIPLFIVPTETELKGHI